jgi:Flp pilus assembly protein TadD
MTATIEEAARLYAAGDLGPAALLCLNIIRNDPLDFNALHLLGVTCGHRGQHADGVSYLLRAAAVRPNDAEVQVNLGSAYGAVQRFDQAEAAYRRAMALGYRDANVLNKLGLALQGLSRRQDAIDTFRAALALDPGHDAARFNLARTLAAAGRLAEAEAEFRRLCDRLPPDTPLERVGEAINELARVVLDQGRAEESLRILRAGAADRSDIASITWNEALVLLQLGRFSQGWRDYETRWDAPNHERRHADYRVLDPDRVAGQRVLVMPEQGRGDVIQFLRYVPLLAARGARVRLSVYDDLIPLALEMPDVESVAGPDDDEPDHDVLTSVMSLALAFQTELGTIPARVPYLRTPALRVARMRQHLGAAAGRRIGLAWSGSAASEARAAMSASLLEPLLSGEGVEFHCLQKEIRAGDRAWLDRDGRVATHQAMLRDFADTAALIDAMDLVISIDTAVAHLAGALARPVWIMLAFNPDWRWMLGRDDSPWYPTARLFRQSAPGDWAGVARSVAAALTV